MARPVLGVKGEKWPCAIKMKLEKVFALGLVISFFPPVELCLSITHFDPLLSISCPHTLSLAAHKVNRRNDPVCGRRAQFTQKTGGHDWVSEKV